MHRLVTVAAAALVTLAGCTIYSPRLSPRVAEVSGGYVREGQMVHHGFLDTGLSQAVRGDAKAEQYARRYVGLNIAGFTLDLAGLGLAGGAVYALDSTNQNMQRIGVGLFGGAALLVLTGTTLFIIAAPSKMDAINVYNDDAERQLPRVSGPIRDLQPMR